MLAITKYTQTGRSANRSRFQCIALSAAVCMFVNVDAVKTQASAYHLADSKASKEATISALNTIGDAVTKPRLRAAREQREREARERADQREQAAAQQKEKAAAAEKATAASRKAAAEKAKAQQAADEQTSDITSNLREYSAHVWLTYK